MPETSSTLDPLQLAVLEHAVTLFCWICLSHDILLVDTDITAIIRIC